MRISAARLDLRLATSFRTAQAVRTDKQTLCVRIDHVGVLGLGEAVPMDTYGQTLASAEACLGQATPMLGDDPLNRDAILDALLTAFPSQLATVAAIDAALHDWLGKRCGLPTMRLLGLDPARVPLTSYSLGLADPDELRDKLAAAAEFPILKIKLGSPRDIESLRIVRQLAPDKIIRVDANMAWSVADALKMLPVLAEHRVEFMEQPLQAADLDGLRTLKDARILPIVADESCVRPQDVLRVAQCVDGINIKLSKCGGIREGLKMIHLARACGLKVMLGCMIESSLGIAAAAQLAPLADWLDLDGHLLLANDPFTGLGGRNGRLTLAQGPGLGVRPT